MTKRRKLLNALGLAIFLLATLSGLGHAQEADPRHYTAADTLSAMHGLSARAQCIFRYEVGQGSPGFEPYDPNQVGSAGELGAAQLCPCGELRRFLAEGWGDPVNPWDAGAYLEYRLAQGERRAWREVLWGWC